MPPRYREPVRVGGGGMAEVYRATDTKLDRSVAIKLLAEHYAADAELRQRFTREALAAGRLSGEPNTVTIYDVGDWRGRPYLVMEYLPGGSLEQLLRREGSSPYWRAGAWLEQAASALDHAHARGIVHRDVKPANLLLDRDGNIHVADFGIASASGLASLTQPGTVLGTAGYLAPEQAEGRPATAAADRYALAVVAFELLTGERPFKRDSLTAEATAHLTAPIPRASIRTPELPAQTDGVFARALAKNADARFPTCGEFVAALAAAVETASAPTRIIAAAAPSGSSTRLRRSALGLLLAALAATGAAVAVVLPNGRGHAASRRSARTVTEAAPRPQTVTVTTSAETRTTPSSSSTTAATTTGPTSSAEASTTSSADLGQQAQALLEAGDFQAALPLLLQAVQLLQGTGTTAEAAADYNLAYASVQLGSCDGVLPLLDRAQAIKGSQPQIDQLRALCTGPPGHRPGHGHDGGD